MASTQRLPLAIISNGHTPYRLHLHKRIVTEMPEVRLISVYTHETSNAPWVFDVPPELSPMLFGKGESAAVQGNALRAHHEWRKGGQIIQMMRKEKVAAVVLFGYSDLGRLRILRWCHKTGIPCFLFGDSNILNDTARGIRKVVKRAYLHEVVRWSTGFLFCGQLGRHYFVKYGARPEQCFSFPYEPDYGALTALPQEDVEKARVNFGIPRSRRLLVYSGRLVRVKRVDLLIEAFNQLASGRPEWDLLIIGDGPLRNALQRLVRPELKERVRWMGFVASVPALSSLYRMSDALVLPSESEPWGIVVTEAAAAGMALVASNVVGAAADLIQEGVNGFSFRSGDVSSLLNALEKVTEPERIDSFRRNSPVVFDGWHKRSDPIEGLRTALRYAQTNVVRERVMEHPSS